MFLLDINTFIYYFKGGLSANGMKIIGDIKLLESFKTFQKLRNRFYPEKGNTYRGKNEVK
ncbi:MAG: hypothetical protein ABI863_05135 [Ginsengibacter sp.]